MNCPDARISSRGVGTNETDAALAEDAGASEAGLLQARRVLKPGGLVAIIEQPRSAKMEPRVQEIGETLAKRLSDAGFRELRLELRPMRPATSICVLGVKEWRSS